MTGKQRAIPIRVASLPTSFQNNFPVNLAREDSRPISWEKRLPKLLDAWKTGWTFYSVGRIQNCNNLITKF
jgi:hypothetical protein